MLSLKTTDLDTATIFLSHDGAPGMGPENCLAAVGWV